MSVYRQAACYLSLSGGWKDYDSFPPRGSWLISLYTTPASKGIYQADIVKPERYRIESGERIWRRTTRHRYLGDAQRWAMAFLRKMAERERQGLKETDDDTFSAVYVALLQFARANPKRFSPSLLDRLEPKMRYFQQDTELWNARLADISFDSKVRDYFDKRQNGTIATQDSTSKPKAKIGIHGYAKSTWNYEAVCINAACKFARSELHVISRDIKAPYYKSTNGETGYARRPAFSMAEVSELLRYLQDESEGGFLHPSTWRGPSWQFRVEIKRRRMIAPLVATLAFSGCRVTELRIVKWRDIDWSHQTGLGDPVCVIRFAKEGQLKRRKAAEDRKTVCWKELTPFLEKWRKETLYPNDDDFVFYAYPGNWMKEGAPLPPCKPVDQFSRLLINILREKGMKIEPGEDLEKSSYSFRHFHCTEAIQRFEIDPMRLAKNLGTSPEMISKFYLKWDATKYVDDFTLTPFERIKVQIAKGAMLNAMQAKAEQDARKLLLGKPKRKRVAA